VKQKHREIGLHDLVEGFLFSLQADGRAPRTHEYYQKLLRHLLKYASNQNWLDRADLVDTARVRQFLSWISTRTYEYTTGNGSTRLAKPNSSASWPYYKALRRLFNWAVEEGFLNENPTGSIHYKAPRSAPIQPYTLDELKRLLSICELDIKTGAQFAGFRNKAMLLLFLDTGLRLKEMAELKLGDLNLEQRYVRIIGKGNKPAISPFLAKTAKAIWLYSLERKRRAKTDALWITEEGLSFTIGGLSSWFVRLKSRAGVRSKGRVHRLRHTAALQYLRSAKDSFLLQLFLRHESLEMSRRYTRGLKAEEAIEAHRNGASPVERLGLG